MVKTEFITMCQEKDAWNRREQKAERYIAQAKRKRRLEKAKNTVLGIIGTVFFIVAFAIVGHNDYETMAKETNTTEQKYIARYGTTYDKGCTIVTEDGNEWTLIDAPEYEDGTEVCVLFDSRRTKKVTDDIIISVTERR